MRTRLVWEGPAAATASVGYGLPAGRPSMWVSGNLLPIYGVAL